MMHQSDITSDFIALVVEAARGAANPLLVRGAVHGGTSTYAFGATSGPADPHEILEAARRLEGRLLIVWNSAALHVWRRVLAAAGAAVSCTGYVLLDALIRRSLPTVPKPVTPEDVAAALQLPTPDTEQPASLARFVAESFATLLDIVPAEHKVDLETLNNWLAKADPPVDLSRFEFGRDFLARLPVTPGVYIMRTSTDRVLYVGKAANVRRRVCSYFTPAALRSAKNRKLHEQLHSLEVVPAKSEIEALLAEMRLIRRHRPSLNVQSSVHEAAERYGRERNLLLLVPEPGGRKAISYFLKKGVFAGRMRVQLGRAASARLRGRIQTVYFSATECSPRAQPWERELVFRWLAQNRRRLNFVDIDDAGSCSEALRQISDYLLDPERLARKVWYR